MVFPRFDILGHSVKLVFPKSEDLGHPFLRNVQEHEVFNDGSTYEPLAAVF
jgi:hypothetical protein